MNSLMSEFQDGTSISMVSITEVMVSFILRTIFRGNVNEAISMGNFP